MAGKGRSGRKYVRDNRGRFATTGATARGGRLATASGNKREAKKIATLSGDRMASVPKGAIGKTRKQREITMIDRPLEKRPAYNQGRSQQMSTISARKSRATAPAAGSFAANNIEIAKGRSAVLSKQKDSLNKQLKAVNAQIKEAGPNAGAYRLQKLQIQSRLSETRVALSQSKAAARPDTAASNVPMAGRRGKSLNAEISRNVAQQKFATRSADKARNSQFKSEQSRAKKLRSVHLGPLASGYVSRNPGRSIGEVKRRISGMEPRDQIKLFRQYVKENRSTARKRK